MARRNSARAEAAREGDAWFAPKRYGYGAGPPIAWQGWVIVAAYCVLVTLSALLILPRSRLAFAAILIGATAALILICALKTRGGWRWRWGEDA